MASDKISLGNEKRNAYEKKNSLHRSNASLGTELVQEKALLFGHRHSTLIVFESRMVNSKEEPLSKETHLSNKIRKQA